MQQRLRPYWNKLSHAMAAMFGLVFYPLARLLRMFVGGFFLAVLALVIPFIIAYLTDKFMVSAYPSMDLVARGLLAIAVSTMAFSVVAITIPVGLLFLTVYNTIIGAKESVRLGWNYGWRAVLQAIDHVFPLTATAGTENTLPRPLPSTLARAMRMLGLNDDPAAFEAANIRAMHAAAIGATDAIPAMSPEQFTQLQMSDVDYASLRGTHQELTEAQIAQLREHAAPEVKMMLEQYVALTRLSTDVCPILLSRPETSDTILLCKQHQVDGLWQPVPGVSHIFDKDSLKEWLTTQHATHPSNREALLDPRPYLTHPTRYVYHNYYSENTDNALELSQESHQLAEKLQSALLTIAPMAEPGEPSHASDQDEPNNLAAH